MLVNDVIADADMDRHVHAQSNSGGKKTQVFVREWPVGDCLTKGFTKADSCHGGIPNHVIHPARFFPQAEFARLYVSSHAFSRGADQSELPVVDRACAI